MNQLLDCLGVPNSLLPSDIEAARDLVGKARSYCQEYSAPFAIVVSAGTFDKYDLPEIDPDYPMTREIAIQKIAENLEVCELQSF